MMNNYLFSGRHPEYIANERAWRRSRDAYSGGAAYIDAALIRHVSEIPVEFEERRRRAYYLLSMRSPSNPSAAMPYRNWSRIGVVRGCAPMR